MKRNLGRPLDAEVDGALMAATLDLLVERGYEQMSIEAVVRRAGTTRPAFYRRFTGLPDLVLKLLLSRFETQLDRTVDTGDLGQDLLAVQREQLGFFCDPLIKRALPGFLVAAKLDDLLWQAFAERFLLPRRHAVAAILRRGADRGEIDTKYDAEWICDLLTGPFLMRAQLPGSAPLDDSLVEASVSAALAVLGCPALVRVPG